MNDAWGPGETTFGSLLSQAMKAKRIDYRTLAGLAGVSHAYLWQLANADKRQLTDPGKPAKRPSRELALRLAGVLDLDPEQALQAAGYAPEGSASEPEPLLGISTYSRLVPDAPRLFQQGLEETRKGNPERGIVLLKQAIGQEGVSFVRAHMGLGVAYLNAKQYAPAIEEFTKTLAFFSQADARTRDGVDLADAHYNRGLAYQDSGKHAQAVKDFQKAIASEGKHADRYTAALCFSEVALGRFTRAIRAALAYLADPETESAFTTAALDVRLYQAYALAQKGQFASSLAVAQATVMLCPSYWYSHYVLAAIASRFGASLAQGQNGRRQALERQRDAIVETGLRHTKRALALHPGSRPIIQADDDFAFLRSRPELKDLLTESGGDA